MNSKVFIFFINLIKFLKNVLNFYIIYMFEKYELHDWRDFWVQTVEDRRDLKVLGQKKDEGLKKKCNKPMLLLK